MASQEKKLEALLGLSLPAEKRTRPDTIAHALHSAILLVDADAACVVLPSKRKKSERLVLYAGSDIPAALPIAAAKSEALRALAAERQALAVADLSESPEMLENDACPGVEAGPVLYCPTHAQGALPAYLAVYRKRGRARYTANETELLLLLSAWLGASLENLRRAKKSDRASLASTALERELKRASRYGHELSVLRVEFDLQPNTNGDGTESCAPTTNVRDLLTVLGKQVRSFDFVGRHGECGAMIVLPQTAHTGALDLAERVRAAIEAAAFEPSAAGEVTATIGVACFPQQAREVEALIAVAERAVDQGQRAGGNRVTTAAVRAVKAKGRAA